MTGTTSNNNDLLIKYTPVLEFLDIKDRTIYIAHVFEHSINYIKEKYTNLSRDQKTWVVIVIKNLYLNNKIHSIKDIENFIDDFILYWKSEYQNYINDLALYSGEYERDFGFVDKYIDKKIGS